MTKVGALRIRIVTPKRVIVIAILSLFISVSQSVYGQCGPNVPQFIVDLSGAPDSLWLSPDTVRKDTCCGSTFPDRCVGFYVTLDSNAAGIIFDICVGAKPPGALFYQVACGTPTPVGEMLCLNGPGPHHITFCKPGSNQNIYCIRSIPKPDFGPDVYVNDGCIDTLWTTGLIDTSIVWTSIFPGAIGAYDSSLSCTEDCDTVIVYGSTGYPPLLMVAVVSPVLHRKEYGGDPPDGLAVKVVPGLPKQTVGFNGSMLTSRVVKK